MSALDVLGRLPARLSSWACSSSHLGFEFENPPDSLEIEPGGRQVLDAAQLGDVLVAVAAAAAHGASRVEQPLALVYPQGLGVDPGQFGGHGDHVNGPGDAGFSRFIIVHSITARPQGVAVHQPAQSDSTDSRLRRR